MKTAVSIALSAFCSIGFLFPDFQPDYPDYFPSPRFDFGSKPLNRNIVEAGRMLFYDPILSADSSVSCASCHSPFNAFAHSDHSLSHGIYDQIGTRNAPPLFNLAWQNYLMWDGRFTELDSQVLFPIIHPMEMGETARSLLKKINSSPFYKNVFHSAFGQKTISLKHVLKSLTQFQLTLVSDNAYYDKVRQGKARFNQQQEKGYAIFRKHCNNCHTEPMFTTFGFENNGLPQDANLKDVGRGNLTGKSIDSMRFKVPSLRNTGFTFPYMHDGRFKKLKDVINHYSDNISPTRNVSASLTRPLHFSPEEKVDLLAFLQTLNDTSFVFNRNFSFPGKSK